MPTFHTAFLCVGISTLNRPTRYPPNTFSAEHDHQGTRRGYGKALRVSVVAVPRTRGGGLFAKRSVPHSGIPSTIIICLFHLRHLCRHVTTGTPSFTAVGSVNPPSDGTHTAYVRPHPRNQLGNKHMFINTLQNALRKIATGKINKNGAARTPIGVSVLDRRTARTAKRHHPEQEKQTSSAFRFNPAPLASSHNRPLPLIHHRKSETLPSSRYTAPTPTESQPMTRGACRRPGEGSY